MPLTAEAFAGLGDVVECAGGFQLINQGTAKQYADLARLDVGAQGGRPRISLYEVAAARFPLTVAMLERHPLSSQLFMPLHGERFVVVVAAAGERVEPSAVRAFATNGRQGVNYHPGTWHHPVVALRDGARFVVLDRAGQGRNCDEFFFDAGVQILVSSP